MIQNFNIETMKKYTVEQADEIDRFLAWDVLSAKRRGKSHANPSTSFQGQAGKLSGRSTAVFLHK